MKQQLSHTPADPDEDKYIPGIYTYCDRWCERCRFTDRCETYAMEQEWTDDEKDIRSDAFVIKLKSIFAETKQMIIEKAEEMGIDPFSLSDEEFAEIRRRQKEFVDTDQLSHLGESYWRSAKPVLDDADTWLPSTDADDGSIADAVSVLCQFLFFIPVNLKSSLNALLDEEGYEDKGQALDPQSYANGTIKVTLIIIERSIAAWKVLLEHDTAHRVSPLIHLLEKIKQTAEQRFPLAHDFIRPGFDEVEMVM